MFSSDSTFGVFSSVDVELLLHPDENAMKHINNNMREVCLALIFPPLNYPQEKLFFGGCEKK